MKKFLLYVAMILLLTVGMAAAADEQLIEIGADYRLRYDILDGTVHDYIQQHPGSSLTKAIPGFRTFNDSLMLDRLGLNLTANAAEDLTVKARLMMYKIWGHQAMIPVQGDFFADRVYGPFDGTIGHVPTDSVLRADYAFATLSNIGGLPLWFSAGRRPTTGGTPANIKQNLADIGTEGVSSIMVDYAFDGATIGYAPTIDALPGAYAKISYGKGFDSGFIANDAAPTKLKDTDFIGVNVVPYNSDNLQVNLEVQKGFHFVDRPSDIVPVANYNQNQQPIDPDLPFLVPTANVGNIAWWGGIVSGVVADFNLFASAAQSVASPTYSTVNGVGMLFDINHPVSATRKKGTAFYVGGRYDIKSTGTKIGLEYNQGSKYWIGMVPAADDIWTSKLGTRGNVTEVYVIQELANRPLMKNAKAFWRLGYQSYKFEYTGSNNWMGAPVKISELDLTNADNSQSFAPLQKATDLYLTFEVLF